MIDRTKFPPEMDKYFDLRWPENLWDLGGSLRNARVSEFEWHLDCPFWASAPPDHIFDLCPRTVLDYPKVYSDRIERIWTVDTSFPITVALFNELRVILDGIHRLTKLVASEKEALQYTVVPLDALIELM